MFDQSIIEFIHNTYSKTCCFADVMFNGSMTAFQAICVGSNPIVRLFYGVKVA